MITGYILIAVAPGMEDAVYAQLKKIPEIKQIKSVFGEYDIIATIDSKNIKELSRIIVKKIRPIEGVITTGTLISME